MNNSLKLNNILIETDFDPFPQNSLKEMYYPFVQLILNKKIMLRGWFGTKP